MALALTLALIKLHFCFSLLLTVSHSADPIARYCANNFTNIQNQTNITTLVLTDITSRASVSGFATASLSRGNNTVYGLAQCRADVSPDQCSACLTNASRQINATCPNQADARLWYDFCFMRYDNDSFIGQLDTGFVTILYSTQNATNPDAFDTAVGSIMSKVKAAAVLPGSCIGRTKASFSSFVTIYALAQCTRDMQPMQCAQCLSSTLQWFPVYCSHRQGCQVLYSSCMVRYEIYPFYFPLDADTGTSHSSRSYIKRIFYPH